MTTDFTGGGDPRRTIELLWDVRADDAARRPGPKPRFTAAEVARAAIAVADADGLGALSMRKVAEGLGVSAMSLYTYVPGKAELIDLMLDNVLAEIPRPGDPLGPEGAPRPDDALGPDGAPRPDDALGPEGAPRPDDAPGPDGAPRPDDAPGAWRGRLERVARDNWALYLRHPWLLQVATSRPPLGPNVIAKYDHELRAVDGIGLTDIEMDLAVQLVGDYVHGAARTAVAAILVAQRTGLTDEEWWEKAAPALEKVLDPAATPTASRVGSAAGAEYNAAADPARAFEFGLARLLDGIAALIDTRR
ncbi:TetR/AcrR family transcriptional regulator C-terminal domain-containing protein [Actinoplanes sp. CA-030573]|uniref:TetR/AcrR family transcriptional regulator C-terminal domain-containing protein n=1 Tax=Actinoplanes sp. CA-030573 TaxID=3239898 RepID=UPI003D948A2D